MEPFAGPLVIETFVFARIAFCNPRLLLGLWSYCSTKN
jgi:hypothetical protein